MNRRPWWSRLTAHTDERVTPEPVGGAAISLDGSRVVFAGERDDGLYVLDAEGGQPVRIAADQGKPGDSGLLSRAPG